MRPLGELLATDEPAWPRVQEWVAPSSRSVDVPIAEPYPGGGAFAERTR